MAQRAMDGLGAALTGSDPGARAMADVLLSRRDEMTRRVDALLRDVPPFAKTRHHGDYHLGQVLAVSGDAIIVDLEGEPMQPLARNAEPGMRRCATWRACCVRWPMPRRRPAGTSPTPPPASAFPPGRSTAASVFLDAYMDAVQGAPGWPPSRTDAERIVRFFMLEKALYEVVYELANPPRLGPHPARRRAGVAECGHGQAAPCASDAVRCRAATRWSGPLSPVGAIDPAGQWRNRGQCPRADAGGRRGMARTGYRWGPCRCATIGSCCRMGCACLIRPLATSRRTCTGRAR